MTENKSFVFSIGDVEVREREFTLARGGEALPCEPKAFRVLLYLLRKPQKLIRKEELLDAVWGDAAVTENSLTRAIAQLRRLLGDDAREPRFIETVATVGYRWVCKVEVSEEDSGSLEASGGASAEGGPPESEVDVPVRIDEVFWAHALGLGEDPGQSGDPIERGGQTERELRRFRRWLWGGGGALIVCLAGAVWYLHRPLPPPRITTYFQITHDGRSKHIAGTDGSRLYFTRISPVSIAQVGIAGGEIQPIPITAPDGSGFL